MLAHAGKVRPSPFRAPLEGVVVHRLCRFRVRAVTLGLGPERPYHLRVAVVAAFPQVYVPAFQLQGGIGLYAFERRYRRFQEKQRRYLHEAPDADNAYYQDRHEEAVFFYDVVFHASPPSTASAAASLSVLRAVITRLYAISSMP